MNLAAFHAMRARHVRLAMVIFDCDGVLIDSESLCDRVVAAELAALGWAMTPEESGQNFLGLSFQDMCPLIEARLGRALPSDWVAALATKVAATMSQEVEMMTGARAVLEETTALGLEWRIASNSSHLEMAAKFGRTGLRDLVVGRLHSSEDMIARGLRGKPAPDLFLAAAGDVLPAACVVIEDSLQGVRAAAAAGMQCLGYSPHGDGAHLAAAGAVPFHDLTLLPALFRAALEASQ
jgi:beta-phosphoglucomutase-like phosphatase (HAD superfamily)